MKAMVKNIEYDTDGEEVNLPTNLEIELPKELTPNKLNIYDIEDYISNEISNITGFCHIQFNYYLQSF